MNSSWGKPLNFLISCNPDKKLFLNLGDEILLNAARNNYHNTFDQNRVLSGLSWTFNDALQATFTYSHQYSSTSVSKNYKLDSIYWFGFVHSLTLN